jgi:hypothetical protein
MAKTKTTEEIIKELVVDPANRIRLYDFVMTLLKKLLEEISSSKSSNEPITPETFQARLREYEEAVGDMITVLVTLCRWGMPENIATIEKIFRRVMEQAGETRGGLVVWIGLRYYPLILLMYSAGIAALSVDDLLPLKTMLLSTAVPQPNDSQSITSVVRAAGGFGEAFDGFKLIKEYGQKRVPPSEYIFDYLKPKLDGLLYLGSDYEALFDRYEVLAASTYADATEPTRKRVWAPAGRYSWKHRSMNENSPLNQFVNEVEKLGDQAPILAAGFFGRSIKRFMDITSGLKDLIGQYSWY